MRVLFVLLFLTVSSNVFAADVRLISVNGVAFKTFKPDIARVYISAWGKGDSAKRAQENSALQNANIQKSLEAYKVKKEDVLTTSYSLNAEYSYDQKTGKPTLIGHIANQEMVVTLRNIEEVGAFMDSLTTASKSKQNGVSVNNFKFDLDKRAQEQSALLGDAVRSAEAMASVLAKAANVKLKGVYRLSPVNNGSAMYSMMLEEDAAAPRGKGGAPTTVSSGEIKIKSEVAAEYIVD